MLIKVIRLQFAFTSFSYASKRHIINQLHFNTCAFSGGLVIPGELIIDRIISREGYPHLDYLGRIYFMVYRWMCYNLGGKGGGSL